MLRHPVWIILGAMIGVGLFAAGLVLRKYPTLTGEVPEDKLDQFIAAKRRGGRGLMVIGGLVFVVGVVASFV